MSRMSAGIFRFLAFPVSRLPAQGADAAPANAIPGSAPIRRRGPHGKALHKKRL